jgi:hypothetical protein
MKMSESDKRTSLLHRSFNNRGKMFQTKGLTES